MNIGLTCCIGCRNEYYAGTRQVLLHRDCFRDSRKTASNTIESASNSIDLHLTKEDTASNIVTIASNKKQRWDKEKYNAYMRLYMQKKRSEVRVNG